MTRKIAILAVIGCAFLLNACNTVHGVGADVESVGKAVKKTSD